MKCRLAGGASVQMWWRQLQHVATWRKVQIFYRGATVYTEDRRNKCESISRKMTSKSHCTLAVWFLLCINELLLIRITLTNVQKNTNIQTEINLVRMTTSWQQIENANLHTFWFLQPLVSFNFLGVCRKVCIFFQQNQKNLNKVFSWQQSLI